MKSTITTRINRYFKGFFFRLVIVDLVLFLLFRYFQPLCEPCLDNDCEPCLSQKQYAIIFIGITVNLLGFVVCIYKTIKKSKEETVRLFGKE